MSTLYLLHPHIPGHLLSHPTHHPGDQKTFLVLASPGTQTPVGSAISCTCCHVRTVSKPGCTPWGLLAMKQLQFFYHKRKKIKQEDSGSAIGCRILTPLASRSSCALACHPCPSAQEKRLVLLPHEGRCPQGFSYGGSPGDVQAG